MEQNLQLSPPWFQYRASVAALFEDDPDLTIVDIVEGDDGVYTFDIVSGNAIKLAALQRLLMNEIPMGNVTLKINFVYDEDGKDYSEAIANAAFAGNPHLHSVASHINPITQIPDYAAVIFQKEVIQFFNDDISDYYQTKSTLAADIADIIVNRESSDVMNIHFSTHVPFSISAKETKEDTN